MSSRPASPPPIALWPFVSGVIVLLGIAIYLLITAGRPPAALPLVVSMVCFGGSIVLCVIPAALENERRVRVAEAAVRDSADAQLRRLAQTADQLAHVVSRGQSTEEQAGQALGTLEEVAERMVGQAEELAAALNRSGEREHAAHAEALQRLTDERDQKLAALEIRLNAAAVALTETQAAIKKSAAATTQAIEAMSARLDELGTQVRAALAARPDEPTSPSAIAPAAVAADRTQTRPTRTKLADAGPSVSAPDLDAPEPEANAVRHEASAESESAESSNVESALVPTPSTDDGIPAASAETLPAESTNPPEHKDDGLHPVRPPRKPRAHRVSGKSPEAEPTAVAAAASSAEADPAAVDTVTNVESPSVTESAPAEPVEPLELALEGMPEPRPLMRLNRREPPGSTSLVATAYIGIGNKLYLRGDGPGLSWEHGVPMQFLAIGKWGWTTTEASVPVTCRVYRNDDTPMLEENIVIDPGTKAEITPKF